MRLFLDESQGDALEVRSALVRVRQAQQLYAVLLIQLGDQPRLTHLLQALTTKKQCKKMKIIIKNTFISQETQCMDKLVRLLFNAQHG